MKNEELASIGILKKLDEASRERLIGMGVPSAFLDAVMGEWVVEEAELGCFDLFTAEGVISFDWQEHLIKNGLLAVGSCLNGDPVAVRLSGESGYAAGYVSHEEEGLYGEGTPQFIEVRPSLDELLADCWDDDFPGDFYEADEL